MSIAFGEQTPLFDVLRHPDGDRVLRQFVPGLVESTRLHTYMMRPVGLLLSTEDGLDASTRGEILERLSQLNPVSVEARSVPVAPPASRDYESEDVAIGSAASSFPTVVGVWERFELSLAGPQHGNPFIDVELSATFRGPDGTELTGLGFYDGGGLYRVRFMPQQVGEWSFSLASNARSLDGLHGVFQTVPSRSPGPVRVAETFHFAYANGTRYLPIGTTCYAWTHQGEELQEETLESLAESGVFNKIRMCIFPKSYTFNTNEPERYPFQRTQTEWDPDRFDPRYWSNLENRIDELGALGIEADVILFHPYDRWGFANMDAATDDLYVRYAVARLSGFRNIWWSLANEFDLLMKSEADWERWGQFIERWDPAGHLRSIHNCVQVYDHSHRWITHVSMQRTDLYRTSENTSIWRENWGKPVVVDECAYEGDIDQGWGNISGQELTRRAWEGAVRGGYVGHGETYYELDEVLWWAKGGALRGSSPERFGFLRAMIEDSPGSRWEPIQLEWDVPVAGTADEELVYYFGLSRPSFRHFFHDSAITWDVDVIDTWNMTIERQPGTYSGRFAIELPGREYIAVRLRRH